MIIDYRRGREADDETLYEIVDAITGVRVPHDYIVFADDEVGTYRYYVTDGKGSFLVGTDDRFVTATVEGPIKILVTEPKGV
jgi:hypothetical protein